MNRTVRRASGRVGSVDGDRRNAVFETVIRSVRESRNLSQGEVCCTGQLPPHVYRATGTRGEVAFTANDIQSVFYASSHPFRSGPKG